MSSTLDHDSWQYVLLEHEVFYWSVSATCLVNKQISVELILPFFWQHLVLERNTDYSVVSVLRIQIRSNQKLFWDESLQKGPDPNRNCIFRHERRRFFFVSDFCIVYVFSKMCFVQSIPRTILWKKSVSIRLLFQQLVYSYSLNWKWTRDVMKCPFENYKKIILHLKWKKL